MNFVGKGGKAILRLDNAAHMRCRLKDSGGLFCAGLAKVQDSTALHHKQQAMLISQSRELIASSPVLLQPYDLSQCGRRAENVVYDQADLADIQNIFAAEGP